VPPTGEFIHVGLCNCHSRKVQSAHWSLPCCLGIATWPSRTNVHRSEKKT